MSSMTYYIQDEIRTSIKVNEDSTRRLEEQVLAMKEQVLVLESQVRHLQTLIGDKGTTMRTHTQ